MKKLIRITTIPSSLRTLLRGQHRFMSQYFEVIGISSEGAALDEVSNNEGIETQVVEMTRTITPFKDLIATYKLYQIFKKEKPFIVHTHTPKAGTLGMIAAKLAKVPHRLHTIAGMPLLETKGFKRMLLIFVEKLTYGCATLILPNSHGMSNLISQNNYSKPNKIKVIANGSSNGIDTMHYNTNLVSEETRDQLKSELGFSKEDVIFIFIGRMVKDKGVNELVSAFHNFSKDHEQCKLILVGPHENNLDPLLNRTENLIEQNEHICAVGTQLDIRPYVAISKILILASYREGFPNVVLQGSCMGLPCIVSDINGCNEIIKHGVNGIIIPPKDEVALENALHYVMNNLQLVNEMGRKSRQNIVTKYKQELVWEELLGLYQNLN